jgi:hypothetical protein
MRLSVVSLLLVFLIVGCNKNSIQKEDTQFPIGKKLYISKCAGCHRLYLRNEYQPDQWDTIMVSMTKKAKISPEEEKEILSFLKER